MSFSSYIRTVAAGTSDYVGIPAFVSRLFRHSGIYVRADAGISKPEDLRGKRIGLPEYQITAVVWMRGMMQHEYGVKPTEIHWRNGGQEEAGRARAHAAQADPGPRPQADRQGPDAGRHAARRRARRAVHGARRRRRSCAASRISSGCFPTPARPSRPTTRRPGMFPIMHLVGIRKSLVAAVSLARRPASTRRSARPRRSR